MTARLGGRVDRFRDDYHDLGGRYLSDRDKQRVTQRPLRRRQNLGVVVEVKAPLQPEPPPCQRHFGSAA